MKGSALDAVIAAPHSDASPHGTWDFSGRGFVSLRSPRRPVSRVLIVSYLPDFSFRLFLFFYFLVLDTRFTFNVFQSVSIRSNRIRVAAITVYRATAGLTGLTPRYQYRKLAYRTQT